MAMRQLVYRNTQLFSGSHNLLKAAVCTHAKHMSSHKHYNPLWKVERREKVLFRNKRKDRKDDIAAQNMDFFEQLKERRKFDPSLNVVRLTNDHRPPNVQQTSTVFDPYVPSEGDGFSSYFGKPEDSFDTAKQKIKKTMAIRRIKRRESFNPKEVTEELLKIYIEAHELLQDYKTKQLRFYEIVTWKAAGEMIHNMDRMTLRWEFIKSLERPKIVHASCEEFGLKGMQFGQVTLRLNSKQRIALYDQFGRLVYGSRDTEMDVLDFVVFEKNLIDFYGRWRMHLKLHPEWMRQKDGFHRSYRIQDRKQQSDYEAY